MVFEKKGLFFITLLLAFLVVFFVGVVSAATVQCDSISSCNSAIGSAAVNDIIQMNQSIPVSTNGTAIDFAGKDNVTFDCGGFSLVGPGNSNTSNYGIYFNMSGGGSNYDTVENCNISGFGYGIDLGIGSYYATVINVKTNFNYNAGIYLENSANYAAIEGWSSNGDGYALSTGSVNNSFSNIYISNSLNAGISITQGWSNFTNVTVVNSGEGLTSMVMYGTDHNIFKDSNFSGNGLNIHFTGADPQYLNNVIDPSNVIDYNKRIYYNYSISNYIFDPTTSPNAGVIYCISCDNITVRDFNLSSHTTRGIFFSDVNNSLVQNITSSNNTDGIGVYGGYNDTFRDITTFNNSDLGIANQGTNMVFDGVTIGGSGISGFYSDGGNNFTLKNAIIKGCSVAGIEFLANNSFISNVTSEENKWGVYFLGASNTTLINSEIINNTDYGIYLYGDSGNGPTQNNLIYNNLLNNSANIYSNNNLLNINNLFSTTLTSGTNIVGGPYIGGNYWDNYSAPGTLISATCTDADNDGICDSNYTLSDGVSTDYYPLTSVPTSNWPMFQGNLQHTGYYPGSINMSNFSLLWNYSTGIDGPSGYSVYGGIIYVAWGNGTVFALNVTTGTVIWNYSAGTIGINTAPAISSGIIYIGSKDDNLYALNATNGSKIWNYSTGNQIFFSSPAISKGFVYVGSIDGNLYALNATTGSQIWNNSIGAVKSSPSVYDGVLYVGASNYIYALNATNGSTIWSYFTSDGIYSSPAISKGVVYFGSGYSGVDTRIYALNATNGSQIWNYTTTGSGVISSPAVSPEGIVYINGMDDNLYALNSTDGSKIWNYTISGASYIDNSPVISEGIVFTAAEGVGFFAFNATDGSLVWNYSSVYTGFQSPIISEGILYFGDNDELFAFTTPASVSSTPTTPTTTAPSGTPTSSSGGAAAVASNTTTTSGRTSTTSATFTNITSGTPVTMYTNSSSVPINALTIITNQTVYNTTVNVSSVPVFSTKDMKIATSSRGFGTTYQSFSITTTGMNDSVITQVVMNFTVNTSWMVSNNIDPSTVSLYRNTATGFPASWNALPTTFISNDSQYYYFSAISPGFSDYTIYGEAPKTNEGGFLNSITPAFFRQTTLGYIIYYVLLILIIGGIAFVSYNLYKRTLWINFHNIWKEINKKRK